MAKKNKAIWEWKIIRRAMWDAVVKLNPRKMMGNPVMFVVEIGSVITTVLLLQRRRRVQVQPADHALALVHCVVRQFCRSHGRRPGQGAGRHAAQSPLGNDCQPADRKQRPGGKDPKLQAARR